MKLELKLLAVAHEPYGTWVATPVEWPAAARAVFDDELSEPFGRAEYLDNRMGVFFKDWQPCEIAEEVAALLHDAGVSAKVSATVKDAEEPAFCRQITVTSNSDGCDLVEIEPTGSSAVLNMATDNE